jgi:hypothetical protein
MDEGTRNTLHKASAAAMVLGGAVGAIRTGGKDYTADMRFKCQ